MQAYLTKPQLRRTAAWAVSFTAAAAASLIFASMAPLIAGALLGMLVPGLSVSSGADPSIVIVYVLLLGLALAPLLVVRLAAGVIGRIAWVVPAVALLAVGAVWVIVNPAEGTLTPAGVVVHVLLFVGPAARLAMHGLRRTR